MTKVCHTHTLLYSLFPVFSPLLRFYGTPPLFRQARARPDHRYPEGVQDRLPHFKAGILTLLNCRYA